MTTGPESEGKGRRREGARRERGQDEPGAGREPAAAALPSVPAWAWDDESALVLVDRLLLFLEPRDPLRAELVRLRRRLESEQHLLRDARQAIEKLDEVIEKVTAPASRIGTLLGFEAEGVAHIVVGGAEYHATVDPRIPAAELQTGVRVLVNEAFAVTAVLGFDRTGPIARVLQILDDERLIVGAEHGLQASVVCRAAPLRGVRLAPQESVRLEPSGRVVVERVAEREAERFVLESAPPVTWDQIGGQAAAIRAIREVIELPLLYPEQYRRFDFVPPKGFLLYGPPGCGKTMIGKATAHSLAQELRSATGEIVRGHFMHVKGPEILNMWVGESERIVRELFAEARERRAAGLLPFIFIDEAESILGTRRASRYGGILSTLVPMFCAEMDGLSGLREAVIILASNRADLIDPAILRPGRIDRRFKIERPGRAEAREILGLYLHPGIPLAAGAERDALLEHAVARLFSRDEAARFLAVTHANGRTQYLYRSDLVSGAILAAIVARAKESALRRAIGAGAEEGVTADDLEQAIAQEYSQGDTFPPADLLEDWLKLLDCAPGEVADIRPIGPAAEGSRPQRAGIVV